MASNKGSIAKAPASTQNLTQSNVHQPEKRTVPHSVTAVGKIFYYTYQLARRASLKKSVVFLGRSLGGLRRSMHWIDFIEGYGHARRLGRPPLELVRKSLATYFMHRSDPLAGKALLMEHFDIASRVIGHDTLATLWRGETVELGAVQGKRHAYQVRICRADQAGARHEGEITVSVWDPTLTYPLCRATFIFARHANGAATVALGGLQGPGVADAKAALVTATRDLNGLRPKDALLLTLKGLAYRLGAPDLFAVANASHVINRRRARRRLKMLTDYDAYWRDRGGIEGGPFGFVIPIEPMDLAVEAENRREVAKRAFWAIGIAPI